MSAPFTRRQGQYLAYIQAYIRLHGQLPSEAEIAAYFGVSPPSAHQMVDTLARRGLIERTPGQARSVRILLPPEAVPDLASGPTRPPTEPAFAAAYPHLAHWIMADGWVELGRTDNAKSMARALDEGGMVWEGKDSYSSVEELLRDLDTGIAQWIMENA
jgi:SOS-response transcriptional repressor LexA